MNDPLFFLEGGGEQARAIRAHDWSDSALGPIETWPTALKVAAGMMLASHFPKCLLWGPQFITLYNDAFRPILGDKPEALGRPFSEVWSEAWAEIGPIAERALQGEATFIEDYPLVVDRAGYPERAYFTFCYSPVRDEAGRVVGMIDTVIETTRRVEAERQAGILNRELAHRIQNLMAVVSSVADQTLQSAASPGDARSALSHRLGAMGQAHALLTAGPRGDVLLANVLEAALAPHVSENGRISASGPPVRLTEKQALALALAVNELATNALKYGALSTYSGAIEASWTVGGDGPDSFAFQWTERGGPAVSAPERRGFGSFLIEQHVGAAFGGEARIDFDPDGATYRIRTNSLNGHY